MSQATPETRLRDLESRVAEQDKTLAEIDEVLQRQWRDLDRLRAELHALARRVGALEAALEDSGG